MNTYRRITKTLATIAVGALVGTTGVAVASSATTNPYEPAVKRPDLPGRTLTIPRRPCADVNDYDWCVYDARREPVLKDDEGNVLLDDQGEPVKRGGWSYWAYTRPAAQPGTEYACITYLDWRYNRANGGCGLVTTD